MKKLVILALFVTFVRISGAQVEQLEGLKQTLDITMDELGNAQLNVSMRLNAAQWDQFKRNVGNNTSLLKREMEKALPKFFLSDFKYSEDPMDRSYTLSFKSAGLATINEDGVWKAELETKNPDITKLSEKEYVINNDMIYGGTTIIKQTMKIHLPESAEDAKLSKDSFGNSVLMYATSQGLGANWTLYTGILLMTAGVTLHLKRRNTNTITWSQLKQRLKKAQAQDKDKIPTKTGVRTEN